MKPPDMKLTHGGGPEHWAEDRRPRFHNGGKGTGTTKTPRAIMLPGEVHKSDRSRRGHE
jgi:hypothetical protein